MKLQCKKGLINKLSEENSSTQTTKDVGDSRSLNCLLGAISEKKREGMERNEKSKLSSAKGQNIIRGGGGGGEELQLRAIRAGRKN